jgi:NaMN:DMB phosphoribosyltransferase
MAHSADLWVRTVPDDSSRKILAIGESAAFNTEIAIAVVAGLIRKCPRVLSLREPRTDHGSGRNNEELLVEEKQAWTIGFTPEP